MKIPPFKELNAPDSLGYWTNKKTGEKYGGQYISLPLFISLDFENLITLSNVFNDFKFPYIFQLAMKYIILFVIVPFLIYRFVFIDQ